MKSCLAENLRRLCSGYRSVSEVCRKLGFNRQQFARYLNGETQPSQHNLCRLASGFGVTVEDLLRPSGEFETAVRPKKSPVQGRMGRLIDDAFPGDITKLRPLLGYYHMHFFIPYSIKDMKKSLIYIYEEDGKVYSKTLERVSQEKNSSRFSKYEGAVSYLGNFIFLVEFETLWRDSIVETMLFPSYRRKLDLLTGLTFGITSRYYRQPFASPIVLKYLGKNIDIKEHLQACQYYSIDDMRVDPRVRKYLQSSGPLQILSSSPD